MLYLKHIKFKGRNPEKELIKAFLSSSQASASTKNFPLVRFIGKDQIVPDIDILRLKEKEKTLIGFEVKIAKPRKKGEKITGFEWKQIYEGIGEAFLYLQYGLDQCGLVLGFHEDLQDGDIQWLLKYLRDNRKLLAQILGPYFNFGVFEYENGGIYEITTASAKFPYYSAYSDPLYGKEIKKRIENFRSNLLAENFTWDTDLARECKYAEKQRRSFSPRFSKRK